MATQYANGKIVTNGLVLALDAADRNSFVSGSTTWRDVSGNNRNFTLTNGPSFNTANGGSIVFDGTNDIATLDITNDNSMKIENFIFANHTYEVWFNLSTLTPSLSDNTETVQALIAWPGYHNGILIGRANPTSSVFLTTNYLWNSTLTVPFSVSTDVTNTLVPNTWYCVHDIINYTSGQSQAYLNGVNLFTTGSVPTSTMTSAQGSPANTISIGGTRLVNNYKWLLQNGKIASVKLYNRVLSAAEVQQNYNAQKSRFGLS